MELKINHVALAVNDMNESLQWYTQKLGFTLMDEYQNEAMQIARIQLDTVILELFKVKNNPQPLPNYRKDLMTDLQYGGTKHVCFEVPDLEKILPLLQSNGIEIIGETDSAYFGGKYIFFKDCNGILLELYQK